MKKKSVNFRLPNEESDYASATTVPSSTTVLSSVTDVGSTTDLSPTTDLSSLAFETESTILMVSSDETLEKPVLKNKFCEDRLKEESYFVELPRTIQSQEELDKTTNEKLMTLCLLTLTNIISTEFHYAEQLKQLYYCKIFFTKNLEEGECTFNKTELDTLFYRVDDIVLTVEFYHINLSRLLKRWSSGISFSIAYEDTLNSMPLYHDCADHFKIVEKLIQERGGADVINDLIREEIPNLEIPFTDLIQFPMTMRSRMIYGLKQLAKYIPPNRRDYIEMRLAVQSIMAVNGVRQPRGDVIGHPLKSGYAVQVVNKKRCLRYLFLFPNNLIITSLTKKGSQGVFFESFDVIRLGKHMTNVVKSVNQSDQMWPEVQKNLRTWQTYKDKLKKVVAKREGTFAPWYLMKVKLLERLISRKEIMLMLLLPTLRLSVQDVINQNVYHFIFSSHCELESWKDLIEENNYPYNELSVLLDYVKNFCQIPQMTLQKYISNPFSYINGMLEVHVHQVRDLDTDIEAFITLQMDSFGGYFNRIYTTDISECCNCPVFDELFEIPLNSSQHLKICFYKKDETANEFELFSTAIFDIWKESLSADYRLVTIPLFMRDTLREKIIPEIDIANPIDSFYIHKPHQKTVLALTLRLISTEDDQIQENPQTFGTSIQETIVREGRPIPIIVTSCVTEIEKRGLHQELIYIAKGNRINVCRLFKAFEKCSTTAVELVENEKYTVYDISQLLLWYIKTLPMSLLQCPESFALLSDIYNETRKEIALRSLIYQLPTEERRVLLYLLDHFVKVCRHIGNKITPPVVGRILCSVFYDLECSEKTSEYRQQQTKFVGVMEYIINLKLEGIRLYTN